MENNYWLITVLKNNDMELIINGQTLFFFFFLLPYLFEEITVLIIMAVNKISLTGTAS